MRKLLTTTEAALLLALSVRRKEAELGKDFVRNRVSEKTLKNITGRHRVDRTLISELNEVLLEFNLLLIDTGEALGILKGSSVKGWPRMSGKRILAEIEKAENDELDFRVVEDELKRKGAS